MKKRIILFLVVMFPLVLLAETGIDSLFNQFKGQSGLQRTETARKLVHHFEQEGFYDYPVPKRLLEDRRSVSMLVYLGMANSEYVKNNFSESEHYAELALSNVNKDSLRWLSSCYEILNVTLQRKGDFSKAIEYAHMDYEIGKKLKNNRILSSALNSLASINLSSEHYDEALKYIDQAIEIERSNPDKSGKALAIRLGMKCEILMNMKRPEEALICINEALDIDSKANRINKVGIRLSQKADVLLYQKKWSECRDICQQALRIFEKSGSKVDEIITLKQLGICETGAKNYPLAEQYLLRGERLCKQIGFTPLLWRIQNQLFLLYKETNNTAKALPYLESSSHIKDSLQNEKYQKLVSEYHVAYETQKKEEQLFAQQKSLHNRARLIIIFATMSVLIGILAVVSTSLARVRKKHNQHLTEVGRTRNQIFSIVSHDLKNPISAQKMMLDYMCTHYDEINDTDKKKQIFALRDSNDSLSDLLVSLLEWASLESGRFSYNPIRTDLSATVDSCLRSIQSYIEKKGITIIQSIPSKTFVLADVNFLETILRNLITNAVKFSYENGNVEITSSETKDHVSVMITDHGVGMRPEEQATIFNKEKNTTLGTLGEKGTGVGLMVCKELIDKSKSSLTFTSEHLKGTTFTLTLPRLK